MKTRIISMLMSICLLFQIVPVTALAFDNETETIEFSQEAAWNPDIVIEEELSTFTIEENQISANDDVGVCVDLYENQSTFNSFSEQTDTVRYSILVLDTSASSSFFDYFGNEFYNADTAINYVKTASKEFISDIQKASGTNFVAIVEYKGNGANIVSEFSTNYNALSLAIDSLYASKEIRSVSAGLEVAYSMLEKISDDTTKKNVVLFTTGMTNEGDYTYDGKYNDETVGSNWRRLDTKIHHYAYANAAINNADKIKDRALLYSVGLFQTMEDIPDEGADVLEFFKLFASDTATSVEYFYDVKDPNELEFVFGEIADDITDQEAIPFKFGGEVDKEVDTKSICYYTDEYFFSPTDKYDRSLATMSLCLELSSWTSHDVQPNNWNPVVATQNAENLLTGKIGGISTGSKHLGFTDFARSPDIESGKPTMDSIGAIAANKTINDGNKNYTLIALAVRGGGYGSEWASNFTIGASGNHDGFNTAKESVLVFLSDYIADNHISGDIKLWIVGFSRGGITANMVAGAIHEGSLNIPSNTAFDFKQDMYCYTFEPPKGVISNNNIQYSNIHNVVNPNDLVPLLAPSVWDFSRYGIQKTLPNAYTAAEFNDDGEAMIAELEEIVGGTFLSDPGYKITETFDVVTDIVFDWRNILPKGDPFVTIVKDSKMTGNALKYAVDWLFEDVIESRITYTLLLEDTIRYLLGIAMDNFSTVTLSEDILNNVLETLYSTVLSVDDIVYIITPLVEPRLFYSDSVSRTNDMILRLQERYDEFLAALKTSLGGIIDVAKFETSLLTVLKMLFETLAEEALNFNLEHVGILAEAISYCFSSEFQAHYPEVSLAWLRSQDPHFNDRIVDTATPSNSSITRVIRINCPVDINVYDKVGTLVASIIDDTVIEDLGSIVCLINSNGEKIVYLPGDGEYSINIIATDNGYVSYAVDEYNFVYGTETRIENYYDVEISIGDVIKALVPEISINELSDNDSNGSSVVYTLIGADSTPIAPDSCHRGDQINDIYYTVSLIKEGNSGYITGAGKFAEGRFAEVEAHVLPSGEFLGWYENGVLLSSDLTYRFAARRDVTLTAKFTDVTFHELKIESTAGGTVSSAGGYYTEGVEVAIVAEPDEGYVFDCWTASNGGTFDDSNNPSVVFIVPNGDTVVTAHFKATGNDSNSDDSFDYDAWYRALAMLENLKFNIEATVTEGGTITPAGISQVQYSKSQTYTMTPNDGYEIISVFVDGTDIGAVTEYAFMDVQRAHTIFVVFEKRPWQNPFIDVLETDWFYDDVKLVNEEGLMLGISTNEFGPEITLNRATIVTTLWRLMGSPVVELDISFTDLPYDWYTGAMKWVISEGIILGYGDDTCRPMTEITHEQVIAILHRFMVSCGYEDKPITLTTQFVHSEWAENDVLWAIENNLFDGFGSDVSDLTKTANRAEIAAYLSRLCELIEE